jgi:hypothetical protein
MRVAIDDPRLTAISPDGRTSEAGEPRRGDRDDAMDGRLREADHGGELAHGEVGAEGDTVHEQTVQRRARTGTPSVPGRGKHAPKAREVAPREGREGEQSVEREGTRGHATVEPRKWLRFIRESTRA